MPVVPAQFQMGYPKGGILMQSPHPLCHPRAQFWVFLEVTWFSTSTRAAASQKKLTIRGEVPKLKPYVCFYTISWSSFFDQIKLHTKWGFSAKIESRRTSFFDNLRSVTAAFREFLQKQIHLKSTLNDIGLKICRSY